MDAVEKRRALEAFLDAFTEEGLEAYHDWHESTGPDCSSTCIQGTAER